MDETLGKEIAPMSMRKRKDHVQNLRGFDLILEVGVHLA